MALLAVLVGAAVGAAVSSDGDRDDAPGASGSVAIRDAGADTPSALIPLDALPTPAEWPTLDGVSWMNPVGQDAVMTPVAAGVEGLTAADVAVSDNPTVWSEIAAARWRSDQWLTAAQQCPATAESGCQFDVVHGPRESSFGGIQVRPVLSVDPLASACEGWLNLAASTAAFDGERLTLRWLVQSTQPGSLLVELIDGGGRSVSATAELEGPSEDAELGSATCVGIESTPGSPRTIRFRFVGDQGAVDVAEMTSVALQSNAPALLTAVQTDPGMVIGVLQAVTSLALSLEGSATDGSVVVEGSPPRCSPNVVDDLPTTDGGPDRWWVQRRGMAQASLPQLADGDVQPDTPIRSVTIAVPSGAQTTLCAGIEGSVHHISVNGDAVTRTDSIGELEMQPGHDLVGYDMVAEVLSPSGRPLCVVSWSAELAAAAADAADADPSTHRRDGDDGAFAAVCPIGDDLGLWAKGGEQVGWIAVSADGQPAILTGLRWGEDPTEAVYVPVEDSDCETAHSCSLAIAWKVPDSR